MSEAEASVGMAHDAGPDEKTLQVLRDMANRLRIRFIRTTSSSTTSYLTPCSSAAEIMSVLFFYTMRYKQEDPENPDNDRCILSKGIPFVKVATGWPGQGLGAARGMAYTGKYFDQASYRVFCLLGDEESTEGSVWEAFAFASYYNLDNLMAIFDVNRIGHSSSMSVEHCVGIYQKRCEAFGWNTYVVDGRNVETLCRVFSQAAQVRGKPTAVVAKTFKARGMPNVEDAESWHGRPMPKERADAIIKLIESQIQSNKILVPSPPIENSPQINIMDIHMASPPAYVADDMVSTQRACGLALAKLGHENDRVIVLDSDTENCNFSDIFKKEHPERFIQCYIAEQNMVNVALGCATRDRIIAFACTFAAFFTRAFDQIRVGAISQININLIGCHCGVSTGDDNPYHMALEDLAMFRAIPNCIVFYPSDAVSTEHAIYLAANTKEMCFIHTSQAETAIIYTTQETFEIGQAKVVRHSNDDKVIVIGAGVTLHEALVAADELSKEDISIRVIDLFTIKPLDSATIISNAKATGGRIVTVEDHYLEGGIGGAVCAAVSMEPNIVVHRLAVMDVPRSGRCNEALDFSGISSRHIIVAVKCILMN
ncbi:rCG43880 [Rattus norvegicus]|uniref:transketolase n=3 Tax=Rattus norvegicus TaxID=10116 RepID=D3ZPV2_RAT|nr:transketolase-like protein 1 [Rattus norvegicus]EDL84992.1 rCG43880 [Rattus norvegicus]|eukprot:NP_001103004.1 transketolase-like protein 1 [Rattus norvegicus]